MAKKVIASTVTTYINSPCERCGKPKMIGKVWKETIETFNGKSVIEHSQIVCSDNVCQKTHDKQLLEEIKKKEALKAGREIPTSGKTSISIRSSKNTSTKSK